MNSLSGEARATGVLALLAQNAQLTFAEVSRASVAENVSGSVDAEGLAVWKLIAYQGKIDSRSVAVGPKHRPCP
jgi:hypothetical protein